MKSVKKASMLFLLLIQMVVLTTVGILSTASAEQRFDGRPELPEGRIRGKVLDGQSRKGIEYANLVLLAAKDSSVVTGAITDQNGSFVIENVPYGKFVLRASFLGYESARIGNLVIAPDQKELDLDAILLSSGYVEMKEVEITSEREAVVYSLDKKVFNVDKNIATAGGSALDVMQNIPSVSVDADGGVALRGSQNVNILVDGRPNGLAGVSSSDVLSQIPASAIDRIEVVTNPSVRYDPEGTAGIINIVMKKKSDGGLNGQTTLNAGTGDRYNSSLALNYRTGGVNVFGSYNNRFNTFGNTSDISRTTTVNDITTFIDQAQSARNRMRMHNATVGADFLADEQNTLTLSYEYRTFRMNGMTTSNDLAFDAVNAPTSRFFRNTGFSRAVASNEFELGYRRTFDSPRQELTADLMYSDHAMDGGQSVNQDLYDLVAAPDIAVNTQRRSISGNTNKMYIAQAHYVHPVGGTGKAELGFKSSYKDMQMRSDYENYQPASASWSPDPPLHNHFFLTELIHAAYGMYADEFSVFKYQVGLRGEYVVTDPREESISTELRSVYTSLYPSLHLVYPFASGQELSLSYSRRVDRPGNRERNPYTDYSDSLSIFSGNPFLKPEYIDSYELGHALYAGKTSLTSALFYRRTSDLISTVSTLEPSGVTRTTYRNLASGESYGIELTAAHPLASWWRFNASASYFRTFIDASALGTPIETNDYSWNAKLNSTMNAWWGVQVQVIANYDAPTVQAQGKQKENYFADIALKRDFMRGAMSLTFRVSDVFDTRRFGSESYGPGFRIVNDRKFDSRVAYLGFTYRLNNEDNKRERERPGNMMENESDF